MFKFLTRTNLNILIKLESPLKQINFNSISSVKRNNFSEENKQEKNKQQEANQHKGEAKPKQASKGEDKKKPEKAAPPKDEKKAETAAKETQPNIPKEKGQKPEPKEKVAEKPADKKEEKPKETPQKQEEKPKETPHKQEEKPKEQTADGKSKIVAPLNLQNYKSLISNLNSEWKNISSQRQINNKNEVAEELLPFQRKFVELLASKLVQMNYYQIHYVLSQTSQRLEGIQNIAPIGYSLEWENLQNKFGEELVGEPKFTEYEEIMKEMSKWYQTQLPGFGIGIASGTPAPQQVQEEKKEVKKEEKKEKEIYDIELTSFDAAKKINLIKEVRAILNLGLKESKELVDKTPCLLMKGVKKTDTEAIVKKLSENGAVVTLK